MKKPEHTGAVNTYYELQEEYVCAPLKRKCGYNMRDIKTRNLFFVIFFTVIYMLNIVLYSYNLDQESLNFITNNLYSKNATSFFDVELSKWIKDDLGVNVRLFLEYSPNYRVYLCNNNNWEPPLIRGEFFNNKENRREAVVGQGLVDSIQIENDEEFIMFNDKKYNVTGIIGADFSSNIDYIVIMSNTDIPDQEEYKIVLDGRTKKEITKKTEQIIKKYPSVKNVTMDYTGMHKVDGISLFQELLNVNAFFLITLSTIMFMLFWYENRKKEITTYNLIGVSRAAILLHLLVEIILGLVLPFVTVFLVLNLTPIRLLLLDWEMYISLMGVTILALLIVVIQFCIHYSKYKLR